ncbi:MAG: histidine phosphatase family protein [Thermoplasmataceae archaeon]
MQMKKAILIRHGESEANVRGILSEELEYYNLTESGRSQAERIGNILRNYRIDGIFSSPILRTRETAEIISKVTGRKVEILEDIRESGLGDFNGKPFQSLPFGGREELGMEPWSSLVKRMVGALERNEGNFVYVSHALPIRAVVAHYLGMNELDSYGIEIRYTSVSAIDLSNGKVLCIGSLKPSKKIESAFS